MLQEDGGIQDERIEAGVAKAGVREAGVQVRGQAGVQVRGQAGVQGVSLQGPHGRHHAVAGGREGDAAQEQKILSALW